MTPATILWKRLDVEGHDCCRLSRLDGGWTLSGQAVFDQAGEPCGLSYEVSCDEAWHTRAATVAGWMGPRDLRFSIERSASGVWRLNGDAQPQVAGLVDVDLGFTPATNLLAVNRLALGIGRPTPAPAAYLSFPELRLDRLDQTYERLSETRYAYASPAYGYAEALEISEIGFVTDYPKLWQAV